MFLSRLIGERSTNYYNTVFGEPFKYCNVVSVPNRFFFVLFCFNPFASTMRAMGPFRSLDHEYFSRLKEFKLPVGDTAERGTKDKVRNISLKRLERST